MLLVSLTILNRSSASLTLLAFDFFNRAMLPQFRPNHSLSILCAFESLSFSLSLSHVLQKESRHSHISLGCSRIVSSYRLVQGTNLLFLTLSRLYSPRALSADLSIIRWSQLLPTCVTLEKRAVTRQVIDQNQSILLRCLCLRWLTIG